MRDYFSQRNMIWYPEISLKETCSILQSFTIPQGSILYPASLLSLRETVHVPAELIDIENLFCLESLLGNLELGSNCNVLGTKIKAIYNTFLYISYMVC